MKHVRTSGISLLSVLICCILFSKSVFGLDEQNKPITEQLIMGIAPFMSPTSLVKRMAPLRQYLSESIGVDVLIETATTPVVFTERTLNGRYDIVFTNPTFSLMALDKGGFQALATLKKELSGCFIVLENSKIQNIKDLGGKLVGAPPKIGFLGQLIEPYLDVVGYDDSKKPEIKYFKSHKGVMAALRLGNTDASLVVNFMEKHFLDKGYPIKTIHRTEGFPGMTMLSSLDLPAELVNKIRMSLFALDQNEKGKKVLKKINMHGFKELDINQLEKIRLYLPAKEVM